VARVSLTVFHSISQASQGRFVYDPNRMYSSAFHGSVMVTRFLRYSAAVKVRLAKKNINYFK
jgi:hypothetical protein